MDLTEVFLEYQKKGFELEFVSHLKSGKEADVCLVYETNQKKDLALKVYKDNQNFSYKLYNPYLENVRINPKFKKMVKTKTFRGRKYMSTLRTLREFEVMKRNIYDSQDIAKIPKPISYSNNTILMDFIGKNRLPAPRLQGFVLDTTQAEFFFVQIFNFIKKLYQNKIVHSDLSPFNILIFENNSYIIDFPQAVEIKVNPNWKDFLARDLNNLYTFFKKYLNPEEYEIYSELLAITK
jgi:serine/threonine-protein kinase RIO1